jgi:hypothetical protein
MCFSAKAPKIPAAPAAATAEDPAIQAARDRERKRQAAAKGNTLLTPPTLATATTSTKTLLGS